MNYLLPEVCLGWRARQDTNRRHLGAAHMTGDPRGEVPVMLLAAVPNSFGTGPTCGVGATSELEGDLPLPHADGARGVGGGGGVGLVELGQELVPGVVLELLVRPSRRLFVLQKGGTSRRQREGSDRNSIVVVVVILLDWRDRSCGFRRSWGADAWWGGWGGRFLETDQRRSAITHISAEKTLVFIIYKLRIMR